LPFFCKKEIMTNKGVVEKLNVWGLFKNVQVQGAQ
jgi:hypothetical protein